MMTISIQGVKGAFHEEAARKYFSDEITIAEQLTFEEVISSVENSLVDAGIMAVENTVSGTIHSNLELIKNANLTITGEIYLRIEQNLAVTKGTKISKLTHVQSHYMAINQCRNFFRKHPHIKLVDVEDTALSMKNVRDQKSTTVGAIGSALAAEYYELEIIAKGIETNKKNYTRFLILERKTLQNDKINKSTIQLVLLNQMGELAEILNIIRKNNINLSKIESLPIIGEPWHYQFYLDILYENINDYNNVLKELKPRLESMSILGNYARSKNNQ